MLKPVAFDRVGHMVRVPVVAADVACRFLFGSGIGRGIVASDLATGGIVRFNLPTYALYMSIEPSFAVSDARQHLASIIDQARAEHAPVYLERRGRRVAAVIDADDLDEVLRLAEDMSDILAAEEARAEMRSTGQTPIPWEQVKVDLGLT